MATRKLTNKQQRFVEEYLVCLNAAEAARRAGYSPKTAHVIGANNLQNHKVVAEIEKGKAKTAKKLGITREWLVERLRNEAIGKKDSTAPARINALTALAKLCGHMVDKKSISHKHSGEVKHKHGLSEPMADKLKEIYAAGEQKAGS